jgi:stalled ribosome alternative rescue factor ArfA
VRIKNFEHHNLLKVVQKMQSVKLFVSVGKYEMTKTAKSLVMQPQYRQKVAKVEKGRKSYTRKIKHKNTAICRESGRLLDDFC